MRGYAQQPGGDLFEVLADSDVALARVEGARAAVSLAMVHAYESQTAEDWDAWIRALAALAEARLAAGFSVPTVDEDDDCDDDDEGPDFDVFDRRNDR